MTSAQGITTPPGTSARETECSSEAEAIAVQIALQNIAALLPEQEWCSDCSHQDDPAGSGMPRDIVDRSTQALSLPGDWDSAWGAAPLYDVVHLDCGHTISWLAS